jgi:hypothetical protein
LGPVAPSAEDQAAQRSRLAILLEDLATLPPRPRSALVMRELSGLSHEDIAVALDTSPGAAKQAIFEARRALQDLTEGRAMPCSEVCRAVSDGDRRVLRGRRLRAHLHDCASCAAFAASIEARRADLRAFAPALPVGASVALLARALPAASGSAGGGAAAGSAGGGAAAGAVGKTIGLAALGSKGLASASLLATAAVSVGGVAAVVGLSHDGRPAIAIHSAPAPVPGRSASGPTAAGAARWAPHGARTSAPAPAAATVAHTASSAGAVTHATAPLRVRRAAMPYRHGHGYGGYGSPHARLSSYRGARGRSYRGHRARSSYHGNRARSDQGAQWSSYRGTRGRSVTTFASHGRGLRSNLRRR